MLTETVLCVCVHFSRVETWKCACAILAQGRFFAYIRYYDEQDYNDEEGEQYEGGGEKDE